MAYNLTMQLNIQAPSALELDRIRRQLESSLSGLNMSISTRGISQANSQIRSMTGSLNTANDAAEKFLETVSKKFTTFAAYTVASTAILKFADAVSAAFMETTKLEAEMLKIAQITNKSTQETLAHSNAMFEISKRYNIAASKVAQMTGTLAQTGLSFRDAAKGAELLAKTSLLATFDSLSSTTEGLIAIINTFELSMDQAGLALEAMNTVSKKYAVESSDLVDVVRRTGGAFKAAGGDVQELFALFTSVRQTTRESAETIATGMRTIFARIQRPETIQYFKDLGIELASIDGKLVGPFEAIQRISNGLRNLGITAGDVRFAEIIEEIGGIRQISKVIPLLTQTKLQTEALAVAQNGAAESAEDVRKAQEGLGYQFGQLQKNFQEFAAEIVGSNSFRFLIKNIIDLTNGLITLGRSLTDLLPLFALVFGVQGVGSLLKFGKVISSGQFSPFKFASGGFVPGEGNGDTVPAMLTPGEFVINKKSAQMFGYGNLRKINKYARGGEVQHFATGGAVGGFVGGVSDAGQDIFQKYADMISPVVLQFAKLYLQTQLYSTALLGIVNASRTAAKAVIDGVDNIRSEAKERKNNEDRVVELNRAIGDAKQSLKDQTSENHNSKRLALGRSQKVAEREAYDTGFATHNNQISPLTPPGRIKNPSAKELEKQRRSILELTATYDANSDQMRGLEDILSTFPDASRAQYDAVVAYTRVLREASSDLSTLASTPGPIAASKFGNHGKSLQAGTQRESVIKDEIKRLEVLRDSAKVPSTSIRDKIGAFAKTEVGQNALQQLATAATVASTALSAYFTANIIKAAEASQKSADEAVKNGNAQQAATDTVKAATERQRADLMSSSSAAGGALGGLIGSFWGPIGTAIGTAAGNLLGTLYGLTDGLGGFGEWIASYTTDLVGLTSTGDSKQAKNQEILDAKQKAVAEAEINALDKSTGKTNDRASLLSKNNTRAATSEFAKGILDIEKKVKGGQLSFTNTEKGNSEDVQQRLRTQFDLIEGEFAKLAQLPENAGKGFNQLSAEVPELKKALAIVTANMKDGAEAVKQLELSTEASARATDLNAQKEKSEKLKAAVDNIIKYQEDTFKRQSESVGFTLEDKQRGIDIGSRLSPTKENADRASSASIKAVREALSQTRANRAGMFGGLEDSITNNDAKRLELSRQARNIPARPGEEQNSAQVKLQKATEIQIGMIETQIRLDQEELSIQEKLVSQMATRVDREIEAVNAIASFKKGLLEQFAVGSISDRNRLGATSSLAKNALATGDLSNVPQELKTSVIELLKGIGQEKDAIAIQAREVEKGTGGRISFEQAKRGLEGQATPTEALKSAINAQAEAIKEQRAIQERISQENAAKSKLELENAANFRDAVNIFREAADIIAGNRPAPNIARATSPQQMEVAGIQDVTVNIPGVTEIINKEVAKITYEAISKKFGDMAREMRGVKDPNEIADAFRKVST